MVDIVKVLKTTGKISEKISDAFVPPVVESIKAFNLLSYITGLAGLTVLTFTAVSLAELRNKLKKGKKNDPTKS